MRFNRGWAAINESDMLLIPDAETAFRQMANDPWFNLGVNRRLP